MESTFAADQRKMNPWPKLVYRSSIFATLGSAIAGCSLLLLNNLNPSNICITTTALFISALTSLISNDFYQEEKERIDKIIYRGFSERRKSYKLAFYGAKSMYVTSGVSFCAGICSLLLGKPEAFAGIMMFFYATFGGGLALDELCEVIKDRDQRRADGSLDENKEGKNSIFVNRLRDFNLIEKSLSNQNSERDNLNESEEGKVSGFFIYLISSKKNSENEEYSLLEELNQYEDYSSCNNERRVLISRSSRSSHSVYGANNNRVTTSAL